MATHHLKTDSEVFDLSASGIKNYEIRFNDRGFEVGDILVLEQTRFTGLEMTQGAPLAYTGLSLRKRVTHILSGYGLEPGWVILSVEDL